MNNIVPGYYVFKNLPCCERKDDHRYYWVIDKDYTIVIHVMKNRIHLIKTNSFKQNQAFEGWGKSYNTICGKWTYLKKTTKELFDYHYKLVRNRKYDSFKAFSVP